MSSVDGERVAKELGCSYVETSARNRINVGKPLLNEFHLI